MKNYFIMLFAMLLIMGGCAENAETQELLSQDASAKVKATKKSLIIKDVAFELPLKNANIYLWEDYYEYEYSNEENIPGTERHVKIYAITDGTFNEVDYINGYHPYLGPFDGATYFVGVGLISEVNGEVSIGEYPTFGGWWDGINNDYVWSYTEKEAGYFSLSDVSDLSRTYTESINEGSNVTFSIKGGVNVGDNIDITFSGFGYFENQLIFTALPSPASLNFKGKVQYIPIIDKDNQSNGKLKDLRSVNSLSKRFSRKPSGHNLKNGSQS
jgi:hypothetical protein